MSRLVVVLALVIGLFVALPARGSATTAPIQKRVAVLLLNFAQQPSEPWAKDAVRELYFGAASSVASYYSELSAGQLSVTGSVFGYLKLRADTSRCSFRDWAAAARKQAQREGISLGAFTNIVYVFPYQRSCWWNGFAGDSPDKPTGRDSWVNGLLSLYVAVHELGHNFGAGHASSLTCTSEETRVAFSGTCSTYEYGDPYDVMGYGGHRLMNAWHRWELGLLADSEVLPVAASGTYHLSVVDLAGDGPRMIRIARPNGGYYFLEIRRPFGVYDDFSEDASVVSGVSIRTASARIGANTKLIDTAPQTCTFNDAPLPTGETFADSINRISITTLRVDATRADVEIRFGSAVAPETPNRVASAGLDTSPGPVPRISVTQVTGRLVAVNWGAADDDGGVDQYLVSVDGKPVGTTCDLMLRSVPLKDGRSYEVGVQAVDGNGNVGPLQTTSYAVPDFTSPTPASQLSATVRKSEVSLSWNPGADNVAVARYRVKRNGQVLAELDANARGYVDKSAAFGTNTYSVVAFDAAGNASRPASKSVRR